MILFDPDEPFPLLELYLGRVSYADQQEHSARVDEWLGLRTATIESELLARFDPEAARLRNERYWIRLPVE